MDSKHKKNQEAPKVNKSKLFIKSIGYAAANLELNSKLLEVFPVEEFGYVDGEITDEREIIEESGVDAKGNVYSDKIETSNSLIAEWMPMSSNRYTAPNIRRGERVLLLQYADDDKYYWVTMGLDDHLRRRETVVLNLSNTVDESTTVLNSDNSYSIVWSTHTKELTIQTSKSDGEEHAYIVKIDTKAGMFIVTDDINNQISIESGEKRITLENADGAVISIDKKNIRMEAPETIDIKAKNVNITSESTKVSTTKYSLNSTTANIVSAKYSMSGGSIDMGGSGLNVGTGSVFTGTVASIGTITNNGVDIGSTHRHGGVRGGGDTTSTPT